MPDEPKETSPSQEENPENAAEAAKKQLSPMIVLAGIVVVALVAAFLVSNMVLKPMFSKNDAAVVEKKEEPEQKKEEKKEKKEEKKPGHGEGEGHGAEEAESSNFLTIDGIVVNPAATGGSRFLSTSIGFEFEESASFDEFKSKEIKIRDALISILSSKTVTELADTKSREMIRRQILKVVNQICQPAQAEAIYFVDFVLQ
jgi:flagellar FliL protein